MNRRHFLRSNLSFFGFGLFSVLTPVAWQPDKLDLILKNGHIIDGTGRDGFNADVGIKRSRIVAIGNLRDRKAQRVIDLSGLTLAPGFIDIHSHSEDELLINPRAESKIRQGVTTEILGQDGTSIAPLSPEMQDRLNRIYSGGYGMQVDWKHFDGYFRRLIEQGIAVNVGTMLGQGTLRDYVVGKSDRPATFPEINKMKMLAREALQDGVLGISSGLEYAPGAFASSEELIEICKAMHFSTGVYATHMRNEADFVLEALDEAIAVARGAEVSLHISHLKIIGNRNWHKAEEIFERIRFARSKGLSVTMDRYPYTAYNTNLNSLFPLWAKAGDSEAFLDRLRNPDILPKLREETLRKVEMLGSWDAVMVTSVQRDKNRTLLGKRISELTGEARDPFEFVRQLVIEEANGVGMCGFAMDDENTAAILRHPYCMIASDASARAKYGRLSLSHPHPRTYGTFPRVLGKYVREDKIMTWPQAIHKMTNMPARRLGLRWRGQVAQNYYADLVAIDPDRVHDTATYEAPHQYPEGIEYVLVNGNPTVEKGEHTGTLAGQIL